jgi:hypothetical protein
MDRFGGEKTRVYTYLWKNYTQENFLKIEIITAIKDI